MGRAGAKAIRLRSTRDSIAESVALLREGWNSSFDPARPEESFAELVPEQHRKSLGQFFTPGSVAALMADWVMEISPRTVLDPAVGPGIFVREVLSRCSDISATAVDIDELAIEAARRAISSSFPLSQVQFVKHDFLTWPSSESFDAVMMNPPYLRHHDLEYEFDVYEEIGKRNGVKISRLANAYLLFIIEACRRLRAGGRGVFIIPVEWANANFGLPLKSFLLDRGLLVGVAYFSHAQVIFQDALTTACILFIEKPAEQRSRGECLTSYIDAPEQVPTLEECLGRTEFRGGVLRRFRPAELTNHMKWDYLLRSGNHVKVRGSVALSQLVRTKRGIATGANSFFFLTDENVRRLSLRRERMLPCIGRATDVLGLIFSAADLARVRSQGKRAFLLNLSGELSEEEAKYVRVGESIGLADRYLLRGRTPWYKIERREPAPIWAAVFGRKGLRFVYNEAIVHNLTTFHCVYPKRRDPEFALALVACLNSKIVQARARAHIRTYGGGLLKFEPRDLLEILVPDLRAVSAERIRLLASLARRLDAALRDDEAISGLEIELDEAIRAAEVEAAASHQHMTKRPLDQLSLFRQ